jgi:hypothetical protein
MGGWVGFRAGLATAEYRKISCFELHNSYLLFNKYYTDDKTKEVEVTGS